MAKKAFDANYETNVNSDVSWYNWLTPGLAIVKLIENKFTPGTRLVGDIVDNQVFRPIRTRLGLRNARTLTEKDFSSDFLHELNYVTDSIANSRYPDLDKRLERGDTIYLSIDGNDYVPNYGGNRVRRTIKDRLTKPRYQLETTLGRFDVRYTKDEKLVTDNYDWSPIHMDENYNYGKLRNIAGKYGTPDSIPDNDKTKIVIKFNSKKKE